MSLKDFAKSEMERINKGDCEMQDLIDRQTLEIIEVFEKQGHSGSSASYIIARLEKLLSWKPLTPLTGEDDEWKESFDGFQNKRFSSVFKDTKDGKAYWIRGKIFSDNGGKTWYSNKESKVFIEFPFNVPDSPEKVYVDKLD